jgi:hypothetical protein
MTQTHGECNPPLLSSARGNAQADALARWVRQQRHLHQSGSLRPDRAARHTQKKCSFFLKQKLAQNHTKIPFFFTKTKFFFVGLLLAAL